MVARLLSECRFLVSSLSTFYNKIQLFLFAVLLFLPCTRLSPGVASTAALAIVSWPYLMSGSVRRPSFLDATSGLPIGPIEYCSY
jgi:xanthine/uracil/vitamin C permease (AzgA family)